MNREEKDEGKRVLARRPESEGLTRELKHTLQEGTGSETCILNSQQEAREALVACEFRSRILCLRVTQATWLPLRATVGVFSRR